MEYYKEMLNEKREQTRSDAKAKGLEQGSDFGSESRWKIRARMRDQATQTDHIFRTQETSSGRSKSESAAAPAEKSLLKGRRGSASKARLSDVQNQASEKHAQERQYNVDRELKMPDSHDKLREIIKSGDGQSSGWEKLRAVKGPSSAKA